MNPTLPRGLHAILRKVSTGILLGANIILAGCPKPVPVPKPPNPPLVPTIPVTTYHYDSLRSGWNQQEKMLNYSNVSSLGVQVIQLDDVNDQVDAQPLIATNVQMQGGQHDVVYVATEGNNVYAFDANNGARLNKVNLGVGPPVPQPIKCPQTGPTVGINGTPVIDPQSQTMYVITYNLNNSNPSYYIHALALDTLQDKVIPPRLIAVSQTLTGGKTFNFNATWERQRPGLLLANGNVYAAFGSFCDWGGDQARGWVLGWQAGSLTPLPANLLTDTLSSEPNGMFLSGVWMSGYGIAGDQSGNIYFSTGNSDPGDAHDGSTNISDSVVRLNSDLTRPSPTSKFIFTPGNVIDLDQLDLDMSAGGVMLLPPEAGPPNMAVATAKDGRMFLLNRDNLGGKTATDTGKLDVATIGNGCWCGPTYFNDGSPHIVSSGGTAPTMPPVPNPSSSHNSLGLWNLQTSPTPKLTQTASGNMPDTVQDPGFFTAVSSDGKSNAIIWAVSRPLTNTQNPLVWLYAFKATPAVGTLPQLFQSRAGSWPYLVGNANIVPVVANGKVYVASYKELDIFALSPQSAQGVQKAKTAMAETQVANAQVATGPEEHQVSGVVLKIEGDRLTIQTRTNKTVEIDATEAKSSLRYSAVVPVGASVVAVGYYENGVLHAVLVWRSKRLPATWPPDR
jgi:hypothetical protein